MAQTGYTPILIYSSSTASQTPAAGNLLNNTLGSELAINITDGKLFYKDNANNVQVIGWKTVPTTAGGTGLTSYAAGDLLYYASGTTLSRLAIGTAYYMLGVNAGGTAPSWQPSSTSVLTGQGDLLYASAANTLARLAKSTTATRYLSNTGTNNNPAWAQIDLSNGVTGTLPTGNGGTGLTSFTANGIVYASSTSALTTGSALSFDGSILSVSSASGFTPVKFKSQYTQIGYLGTDNSAIWMGVGSDGLTTRFRVDATNDALTFSTASTQRAQIFSSGGMSIGDTTDPGAGNLRLANGNLVVGTSGKGIDFSATAGTGTSELLADYEEGTWTPAIRPDGTGTAWTATVSGTYTKIGRLVFLTGSIAYSAKTSTGNYAFMTGLPFTPSADSNWNYCPLQQDTTNNYQLKIATNPRGEFYKNNAPGAFGPLIGSELGPSTGTITFALCYEI